MSLISNTIPNLVNGVSQQPYTLRLVSQCDEQINGFSSVVEGLRKRPGTTHIAKLPGVSGEAHFHTINRDSSERYVVVIQEGDLRVFDLEGNEKTVNFPDGKAYLTVTSPEDLRSLTVADYTFILNTKTVVTQAADLTAERDPEALVWFKQGNYGSTYKVIIDGTITAQFITPSGSDAADVNRIATDYLAERIYDSLIADGTFSTDFDIDQIGSTLWIRRKDGGDFTISSEDSNGDTSIQVVKDQIQQFSDLPARAVSGFTVEIVGDQTSSFDNYFVVYDDSESGENAGVWKESVKGGEEKLLGASTMPHALIRQSDGTFTFEEIDWTERKVGDLESNPMPSFVDRTINDIFFHRNRLGFVSDENIIFSKAGDFFNFFRGTATAVLDDDPIDVGVSHVKVSLLRHAIPFNETLLLFSDQTQFQLGETDLLTPDTVSVNQTTEFECSLRAKPVGAGRFVYFATSRGSYTGIREYYVDGTTEAEDALEITGHVPKYIPGGVFKIASSSSEDVLVVLSDQAPNELFIYKYFWSNNERQQSSWSRWKLNENDRVRNCDFIESSLYLLIERDDGTHLEVVDLEPGAVEEDWDIHVHLDSKVDQNGVEMVYDEGDPELEGDDVTYVTLPYKIDDEDVLQVVCAAGAYPSVNRWHWVMNYVVPANFLSIFGKSGLVRDERVPGYVVDDFEVDNTGENTVITLKGDWTETLFYIGKVYEFRYRFSTLAIKEEALGGGQQTVTSGRLQVRKVGLSYATTGYFRAEVTPFARGTYTNVFSGRVSGSGKNIIGQVAIEDGVFSFPVAAKNDQVTIELVNDTFLPCFFLSAEWEAFYTARARRF